jgi:hypothetical protein
MPGEHGDAACGIIWMVVRPMSLDTDPETERVLTGLLREAPEWRRVEIMCGMIETLRGLVMGGVRERYPDAGEDEVRRRAADILLGPELAEQAYGPFRSSSERAK